MPRLLYPPPAAVVWTPVRVGGLLVRHVGLVSERWAGGAPTVLHRSKRRELAVEERWVQFANGLVYLDRPPLPDVPATLVLGRARALLGSEWRMVTQNCEHYVAVARGEARRSGQVRSRALTGVAALGAGALAASRLPGLLAGVLA